MMNNDVVLPRSISARLAKEVAELQDHQDFRLVVDEETGLPPNLQQLVAEIEGPADTPYAHKFFLIRFTFSSDFPTVPPTAHFLTKVYHPNVDISTGAICVNTLKKDWEPTHTLKHILSVIRCLLLVPFPESSLNADAGKLFMESYEEYFKRAAMHADVHGRPNSVVPSSSKDESKNNNNDENNGVLQNSSDNTQNPATKKKKLVSKKKSLKRL